MYLEFTLAIAINLLQILPSLFISHSSHFLLFSDTRNIFFINATPCSFILLVEKDKNRKHTSSVLLYFLHSIDFVIHYYYFFLVTSHPSPIFFLKLKETKGRDFIIIYMVFVTFSFIFFLFPSSHFFLPHISFLFLFSYNGQR